MRGVRGKAPQDTKSAISRVAKCPLPLWKLLRLHLFFPSPPVANISGKKIVGALFIPKVHLETGAPDFASGPYVSGQTW
jgi:hypothetical protein